MTDVRKKHDTDFQMKPARAADPARDIHHRPGQNSGKPVKVGRGIKKAKRSIAVDQLQQDRAFLAASGQFDIEFYLKNYQDVATADVDPIVHYLIVGASEGRNPSPSFSTRDYCAAYPKTMAACGNPLLDAIRTGFFGDRQHGIRPIAFGNASPLIEGDIRNAHHVFFGHPIAPRDMVDVWLGSTGIGLITSLLLSDEFRVGVAEPFQQARGASWISHAGSVGTNRVGQGLFLY